MEKKDIYKYLLTLSILLIIALITKLYFKEYLLIIDNKVIEFFQKNIVNNTLTKIMKVITNFGGLIIISLIFIISLIIFKKDRKSIFNEFIFALATSVIFKNIIRRERPLENLIRKPSDYSFPSGHTLCSVALYGYITYLLIKNNNKKWQRNLMISISGIIILIIAFSRIYLNVHYFSDVIGGLIIGIVCLFMFVTYDKTRLEIENEN